VPFAYYAWLSRDERALYELSNLLPSVRVPRAQALWPQVEALRAALASGKRPAVEEAAHALCEGLTRALRVPPVQVQVLLVRPSSAASELHGLYTWRPGKHPPRIQLWMRTAKLGRVVAFRTFLRTLIHEVCHHLDLELYALPLSLHTEGFYRRESSLFHQLVPGIATGTEFSSEREQRSRGREREEASGMVHEREHRKGRR
jgi:hypothetical protein